MPGFVDRDEMGRRTGDDRLGGQTWKYLRHGQLLRPACVRVYAHAERSSRSRGTRIGRAQRRGSAAYTSDVHAHNECNRTVPRVRDNYIGRKNDTELRAARCHRGDNRRDEFVAVEKQRHALHAASFPLFSFLFFFFFFVQRVSVYIAAKSFSYSSSFSFSSSPPLECGRLERLDESGTRRDTSLAPKRSPSAKGHRYREGPAASFSSE